MVSSQSPKGNLVNSQRHQFSHYRKIQNKWTALNKFNNHQQPIFLKIVPVARLLITKNLQNLRMDVSPTTDKVNFTSHEKQLFGQVANDWNFMKMQHIGGYLRLASMHTHLLVIFSPGNSEWCSYQLM